MEYPTAVGPIDILAVDEQDNFVVFDIETGMEKIRHLDSFLRYMGWVKAELAHDKGVSGVIVPKT